MSEDAHNMPVESFEHARRRVFKGIVGRPHTSLFELATRAARRERQADAEANDHRTSRAAAESVLVYGLLANLIDPAKIAKRRARKMKLAPGRYGIRSELADTPLGRKVAAETEGR